MVPHLLSSLLRIYSFITVCGLLDTSSKTRTGMCFVMKCQSMCDFTIMRTSAKRKIMEKSKTFLFREALNTRKRVRESCDNSQLSC